MPDNRPQFFGEFENVPIDAKGRLIVPATLRNALPNGVTSIIVTEWFDGCLSAIDPEGWRRLFDQLRGLSISQVQTRQLVRKMAGRAAEIKLDRQGRALIPKKLLNLANITDHATLTGVVERIEIWNPDRYNDAQNNIDLESVAEELEWF